MESSIFGFIWKYSKRQQLVILDFLIEKVEAGLPLHQAMHDYGAPFDDMVVGMVRAADASGRMAEVLHQLADLLERTRVTADGERGRHFVDLIDLGEDSLAMRVHLIRAARELIARTCAARGTYDLVNGRYVRGADP